jgi:hypothetical protein
MGPTVAIRFPVGVLFDVMMRGGPVPARYHPLGGQLVNPPTLAFTPDEAIVIRNWLVMQPEGFIDLRDRQGAIARVNQALRILKLCTGCGTRLEPDEIVQALCRRCSA